MRKLYALLAGFVISLVSISNANAENVTPDVANFTVTIDAPNNNAFFTNTSTIGSEPGIRRAYWNFGDGVVQMTGPLDNTQHHYQVAGIYNICLKIYRYRSNVGDSVLSAQICKTIIIQTVCRAEFLTLSITSNPLLKYFIAQPFHNQNKKPVRVCWQFGDGRDTCINYPVTYNGAYGVSHLYAHAGNYNVCVNILYDGGCQAHKCKPVEVIVPDSCRADFEKLPVATGANPLQAIFRALPWHNNNKKPVRICWQFGDGRDTCIQYSNTFPGPYLVSHTYANAGIYEVCVKILYQGGCEARKCDNIRIGRPDSCRANFERIPSTSNNPLRVYYRALPWHNNNKKPQRICWQFGDGRDTCINYPNAYTGQYIVSHTYQYPGLYEVCIKILYYGGCEARKCNPIQVGRPDTCRADFERLPVNANNPLQAYFRALPQHNNNRKPARICWDFGDNRDTCINYPQNYTGQYVVAHRYNHPGQYEVCVRILYYGGCEARKCKLIQVGERPDSCRADFERLPSPTADPRRAYFRALPWHNNNKKPARICWEFGDGRDTCINYPNTYTGQYVVAHNYQHNGLYEVCVKILYYGGCEARKCKLIQVGERPDSCRADFEKLPNPTANNPLQAYFRALPWHNNNKKPARICWEFGDGRDTCINYPNSYTGQYVVSHRYNQPGQYEVCVKIFYYGGCEARKCKQIVVPTPNCRADFERIPTNANPLRAYFRALPWHVNNMKPARICWEFGDGQDTCINYPASYTGQYVVAHNYQQRGLYEVCVKILYYGGCEARKCKPVQIGERDSCSADFERAPINATNPLTIGLKALPWNNNNRKPSRVCWEFGDGRDTCINYPESYTGQYTVIHRYLQPGHYEVCVKIFYYGGCEARKCKTIVVPLPQPECSVRLFEITPSITSLVRGFIAVPHSTPPRRPERICWYFGDGDDTCIMIDPQDPFPDLSIRHTYPGPGVYRACVRIRFQGGCIAEDCKEVVIRNAASICGGFMIDSLVGPRTYKFKGFSIHAPNDDVIGYRWTFGDGTSATGREVTHTYNHGGNYEVCLMIKTRLGCETRICRTLRVPGNNQPTLHLSPNPVINVLNVSFISTHTEQVNIKILNALGNQVRTFVRNVTVGPNTWTHDLSNLTPGVYSYVVQSSNQLASAIFIKL